MGKDKKGYVYLLTEYDHEKFYKIGMTTKDVQSRMNELQTGNSSELLLVDYFETDYPYKIESWLHKIYQNKNKLNEWYHLSDDDVKNFKANCQEGLEIIKIKEEFDRKQNDLNFWLGIDD